MLTGNGVKMTRNLYVLNSNKYSNSQITIDKKIILYIKKRQSSQQLTTAHCSCGLASRRQESGLFCARYSCLKLKGPPQCNSEVQLGGRSPNSEPQRGRTIKHKAEGAHSTAILIWPSYQKCTHIHFH